ncbi:Mercuric transport protein periplasmic component precursor [Desulfuromonas sp. DDH964]|nr:Mercuric transport protein periplasmic component precursor [Desulfuromonas sp. DDH964]
MKKVFTLLVAVLLLSAVSVQAAQQVEMEIEGMTCALCPLAIKRSLAKVPSVSEVNVSFEEKKAHLTVDDAVADEALEEAVRKAGGYTGKVIERKPER